MKQAYWCVRLKKWQKYVVPTSLEKAKKPLLCGLTLASDPTLCCPGVVINWE